MCGAGVGVLHRSLSFFCFLQVYTDLFFKVSVDDAGAKAKVIVCVLVRVSVLV